jgi:hypothetical protein
VIPRQWHFVFRFWVRLCCDRSKSPCRRAAPCAAHVSAGTERQSSNQGVSDPGAGAGFRPALVRRGRSRHGCRCRGWRQGSADRHQRSPPFSAESVAESRRGLAGSSWRVLAEDSGRSQGKKLGEMLTPTITRSSLDLYSAPSRLVASLRPRDRERLSALTAPARRLCFRQLRDAGDAVHRASDDTIASACG